MIFEWKWVRLEPMIPAVCCPVECSSQNDTEHFCAHKGFLKNGDCERFWPDIPAGICKYLLFQVNSKDQHAYREAHEIHWYAQDMVSWNATKPIPCTWLFWIDSWHFLTK